MSFLPCSRQLWNSPSTFYGLLPFSSPQSAGNFFQLVEAADDLIGDVNSPDLHRIPVDHHPNAPPALHFIDGGIDVFSQESLQVHLQLQVFAKEFRLSSLPLIIGQGGPAPPPAFGKAPRTWPASSRSAARARGLSAMIRSRSTIPTWALEPCQSPSSAPRRKAAMMGQLRRQFMSIPLELVLCPSPRVSLIVPAHRSKEKGGLRREESSLPRPPHGRCFQYAAQATNPASPGLAPSDPVLRRGTTW